MDRNERSDKDVQTQTPTARRRKADADQQASTVAISAPADNLSQSRAPSSPLARAGQCLEHIFRLDGSNMFSEGAVCLIVPALAYPRLAMMFSQRGSIGLSPICTLLVQMNWSKASSSADLPPAHA
ncbi:hypothetical protein NQZ68_016220 [Dissostichus eleginoides]|nr:hypothetical protein NQZ68_016220 [Dissostichus eleginoides]